MPYPDNLRTATEVEDIVRNEGCVPATIAILNGTIRVGLDAQDLETLARTGRQAHKTSRRDLALVVSQKLTGATTVSSTIMIAHAAGIPIFVTGGIGGVHRGAETSLDISADLTELGRTPVAVVCAGCKSILDIEKTLEFLETQGVPVVTHGPNKNFPAFYTPKSGHQSMASLPLIEDCAELVRSNRELELQTGMVIAVPIPKKDVVQNADKMEELIKSAVQELKLKGIKGKEVTPYLLAKMKALTGGDSLRANIALVKNNARVGSRIAKALSELDKKAPGQKSTTKNTRHEDRNQKKRPLIIGGTVMDVSAHYKSSTPIEATSNLGRIQYSVGGVGRNVAEACQRTGGSPRFISAVGDDFIGHGLLDELSTLGLVKF